VLVIAFWKDHALHEFSMSTIFVPWVLM